jgi:solute carrier family 25 phosphate transporter 3
MSAAGQSSPASLFAGASSGGGAVSLNVPTGGSRHTPTSSAALSEFGGDRIIERTRSRSTGPEPNTRPTSGGERDGDPDDEDDNESTRLNHVDRTCWFNLRVFAFLMASFVVAICYLRLDFHHTVRMFTAEYFVLCAIGGAIGGIPHVILVPVDLLKCRCQVGEYASVSEGWASLRRESATAASWIAKINVWCRGWAPTVIGYTLQSATKFGLYELFKFLLASAFSYEFAHAHLTALFVFSAAAAELVADVMLAPWEALKVRMQTSRQYPPVLAVVAPRVWALEGLRGYYKGLPALWCRQVPLTVVKFTTFENTVRFLAAGYTIIARHPPPNTGTAMLVLTVSAGYIAGIFCATVSHPADTLISKLNHRQDNRQGALALLQQMPCREVWKGWALRVAMVGTLTALQWLGYDGFRFAVGLPTTGRAVAK